MEEELHREHQHQDLEPGPNDTQPYSIEPSMGSEATHAPGSTDRAPVKLPKKYLRGTAPRPPGPELDSRRPPALTHLLTTCEQLKDDLAHVPADQLERVKATIRKGVM